MARKEPYAKEADKGLTKKLKIPSFYQKDPNDDEISSWKSRGA